jgi:hypothetical protein
MRTAAHLIGRDRGASVLFLFYTIFPRPLRLCADTPQAPILSDEQIRPLRDGERDEVEAFIRSVIEPDRPIMPHRRPVVNRETLRDLGRHVTVRLLFERDNDYLTPSRYVLGYAAQRARRSLAARLYEPAEGARPFVYFPLHVTDDFKVKRLIPHCADQEYLIRQVAEALPQGHDLVLKEHPVAIGRTPVRMLRRLARIHNVRIVDPHVGSQGLIDRSAAVAVISSTVGLEALLHAKPVLTMGAPFYSGYGVTLDIDSFREIRRAVPELLDFRPDRERILQFLHAAMRSTDPGAPFGADASDENARTVAASLDTAARRLRGGRPPEAVAASPCALASS